VSFDLGCALLLGIRAYYSLLFVYIIFTLLQSLADLRVPDVLRPALNFVYDVCEPFLRLFRGLLPALRLGGMGLDLSPLIAFLVLNIVASIVARSVGPC
jgi:YggT family protein